MVKIPSSPKLNVIDNSPFTRESMVSTVIEKGVAEELDPFSDFEQT